MGLAFIDILLTMIVMYFMMDHNNNAYLHCVEWMQCQRNTNKKVNEKKNGDKDLEVERTTSSELDRYVEQNKKTIDTMRKNLEEMIHDDTIQNSVISDLEIVAENR